MQESKDHHHYPAFMLNRWCGATGRVHVARNFDGRIAWSDHPPEHVGYEPHLYFYDERLAEARRDEIETDYLKPLDTEGARILGMILAGQRLDRRDRIRWAQFLLTMKARTPESISRLSTFAEEVLVAALGDAQADYDAMKGSADPATPVDYLRLRMPGFLESQGVKQLPRVTTSEQPWRAVLSFDWFILDFERSTLPLVTSDRPCVYTAGLDDPNCVIALPLSPRHSMIATPRGSRAHRTVTQGLVVISQLARGLNSRVVSQAESRAFCQSRHHAPDNWLRKVLPNSR